MLGYMEFKDWIALADIILKTLISGGVGWIGWLTYNINRDKLKLDLYNRRLAVYLSAVEFFGARTLYPLPEKGDKVPLGNESAPLRDAHWAFVKQTREASFLFGKDSEVYNLFENFSNRLLDPNTPLDTLPLLLDEIETAMIPWLHFENISKSKIHK